MFTGEGGGGSPPPSHKFMGRRDCLAGHINQKGADLGTGREGNLESLKKTEDLLVKVEQILGAAQKASRR